MKKRIILIALTIVIPLTGGFKVKATSNGISESKIDFIAGDGVVTPPVNPKDPDNPIIPTPIDSSDPENKGTGQIGPLSVDYVSNLKFGQQKISGRTIAYKALNADPFVQVTDLRGSGDGWSLSAKMSPFTNKNNQELKGATLSMKNSMVKAGSTSNISLAPVKSDLLFDNQESKLVMNASNKGGRGTWLNVWSGTEEANESIQLNVLAGTPEANTEYTSSITWELEDAPK
ncbi:WxL domain-containing protein [Carnobacterium maltaromaticum]|uniref:WxL domain-containing protein n=1 Tax=Carnobacterium maltaromaticum TaxID=2751 RepID=UPI0039BEA1CF